jgi:hypothetical protein
MIHGLSSCNGLMAAGIDERAQRARAIARARARVSARAATLHSRARVPAFDDLHRDVAAIVRRLSASRRQRVMATTRAGEPDALVPPA